ncbi:hypothetical protein ACOME3_001363 [Neoechinorhynchus agilis]
MCANHLNDMSPFYPFLMPFFLREFSNNESSISFLEMVCARLHINKYYAKVGENKDRYLTYDLFVCVALLSSKTNKRKPTLSSESDDGISYLFRSNTKKPNAMTVLKMTDQVIKRFERLQT